MDLSNGITKLLKDKNTKKLFTNLEKIVAEQKKNVFLTKGAIHYLTKKEYDFSKNIVNKMSLCNKKSIHQMIHRSEFKRQQAPPVIVLRPNSLSLGRKTPITACYASAFSYKDI